jgi:hypothetical protein
VAGVVAKSVAQGGASGRVVLEVEVGSAGDVEPAVVVSGGSEDAAAAGERGERFPT